MRAILTTALLMWVLSATTSLALPIEQSICRGVHQELLRLNNKTQATELSFDSFTHISGAVGIRSTATGRVYFLSNNTRAVTADIVTASLHGYVWLVSTPTGKGREVLRTIYMGAPPGHCVVVAPAESYIFPSLESVNAVANFEALPPMGKSPCSDVGLEAFKKGSAPLQVTAAILNRGNLTITYRADETPIVDIPIRFKDHDSYVAAVGHAIRGTWLLIKAPPNALQSSRTQVTSTSTNFITVGISHGGECIPFAEGDFLLRDLPSKVKDLFGL